MSVQATPPPRTPLSRDRVLRAAVAIADEQGLEAVTMRRIAETLGSEAMSLYYHVGGKEDLLDGIVETIAAEINDVTERERRLAKGEAWQDAVRARILLARKVFLRHPWAPRVFETRQNMSPAVIAYHDGLVGLMREGGFSYDLAHHALHALGSRALGFTQELFDPGNGSSAGDAMPENAADLFPNLVAMLGEIAHDDPDSTLGWCDDQTEFEFGLDLILDGLDRMRISQRTRRVERSSKSARA